MFLSCVLWHTDEEEPRWGSIHYCCSVLCPAEALHNVVGMAVRVRSNSLSGKGFLLKSMSSFSYSVYVEPTTTVNGW